MSQKGVYHQIAANKRKTVYLLVGFFVFIAVVGWLLAKYTGSYIIFIVAILIASGQALFSYFGASKMAIASSGAKEISRTDHPKLWRTVENLSLSYGMPMPKVYIIEDQALNAFATGKDPDHAAVAATRGLLDVMTDQELEGVIAHELGHVKNYDIRVSMIVFGLVAVIGTLANIFSHSLMFGGLRGGDDDNNNSGSGLAFVFVILSLILAPIAASMIQLAISRKREYLADATGSDITRHPEGLASALEKIAEYGSTMKKQDPTTAHLFFASPLKSKSVANLFSTHPPIEQRIAILRNLDRVGA
jgi:heat shock protein HtpX